MAKTVEQLVEIATDRVRAAVAMETPDPESVIEIEDFLSGLAELPKLIAAGEAGESEEIVLRAMLGPLEGA